MSFVSPYRSHQQNQDLMFSVTSNNGTSCIVTTMEYPNNLSIINLTMQRTSQTFNSTILSGNFTTIGDYCFNIECTDGVTIEPGSVCRDVTKTGSTLESSEAVVYVILAFGVFFLFILSFYFMIMTPYGNKINDNGAVIQLTKLKYVKLGLILLTWVSFTWFLNILISLADNLVSINIYYGFFGFIFQVMNKLALPLGIVIIVIALFEIIRDANLQENISKFGSAIR